MGSTKEWLRRLRLDSGARGVHGPKGTAGEECLGDQATVELVQLLLGQHQTVSLS